MAKRRGLVGDALTPTKILGIFLQCQYIFYLNLYFTKEGGSSAQGEPRQDSVEHSSWTLESGQTDSDWRTSQTVQIKIF